nr:helix-turn-helix domain-containing protein [uncultured Duganella sp.]
MTTPAEQSELLTPAQMAQLLGVSTGTLAVWRCTKRYPLPYIKVGRSVRYSRAQGNEFIAARTINT